MGQYMILFPLHGPIVYRLGHGLFKAGSAVRLRVGSHVKNELRTCGAIFACDPTRQERVGKRKFSVKESSELANVENRGFSKP